MKQILVHLDAVAGRATDRISECPADASTVCCCGSMSGDDPTLSYVDPILRDISLTFMLGRALPRRSARPVRVLSASRADRIRDGALQVAVGWLRKPMTKAA